MARYDEAQKVNFFLIKTTPFQVGKQALFLVFFRNLLDSFHVILAYIFIIYQDVIKIHDNKNIKFFHLDFINVALKVGKSVEKTEKYDLVLEIAVPRLETVSIYHPFKFLYDNIRLSGLAE